MSQLLFCFCQEEMQIRWQKVKLTLIRKNCCPRWANRPKKKGLSALNNIFPAFNDSAFKAYKQTALTEHVLCVRDTHRHRVFTSSALWLMIEQDGGWNNKILNYIYMQCWLSGERVYLQCRRLEFNAWIRKSPCWRKWQPTPVCLPEESHGQSSLGDCSPGGHAELDTTEGTEHTESGMWKQTILLCSDAIRTDLQHCVQRWGFSLRWLPIARRETYRNARKRERSWERDI